jgi:hypothetical protein
MMSNWLVLCILFGVKPCLYVDYQNSYLHTYNKYYHQHLKSIFEHMYVVDYNER